MIDKQLEKYILEHLGAENSVLNDIYRHTNLKVLHPAMISGHEQGRILSMMSHMIKPRRILEIGAFTGYSAICLAAGLCDGGHMHTIEIDDELAETASSFFKKAGLSNVITLHIGNALEIIPQIDEIFDLVFIDAAKNQYLDYYNAVFDKLKQGGFIVVDNILWYGKVADPLIQDETTMMMRDFNAFIRDDERVEKAIVKNRDGLFVLRKI